MSAAKCSVVSSDKNMKKFPKGCPEHRVERRQYLSQLVHEYDVTNSVNAKLQVMGNLANFAYDKYNFEFLRDLKVIEMFLYELASGKNPKIVQFAMGGLCNCSPSETMQQEIIRGGGIKLISRRLLSTNDVTTIMYAIGALTSLISPFNQHEILTEDFKTKMHSLSVYEDARIRNLAVIFLTDVCPAAQLQLHVSKSSEDVQEKT